LPLLVVSAAPGLIVAIFVAALVLAAPSSIDAWSELGFYLHLALTPFYIAGVTVALHRRRLRADAVAESGAPRGRRLPLWIVAPAASTCAVAVILILHFIIADRIQVAARHVDRVDASCSNFVRDDAMGTTSTQHVVVFDRRCAASPNKSTVNVSILAPGAEIDGPGNVFVGEEFPSPPGGPEGVYTMAFPEGPHRVHVTYAPQTHVLQRREKFGDITIDFVAATLPR
jgi:hypothetical protein